MYFDNILIKFLYDLYKFNNTFITQKFNNTFITKKLNNKNKLLAKLKF